MSVKRWFATAVAPAAALACLLLSGCGTGSLAAVESQDNPTVTAIAPVQQEPARLEAAYGIQVEGLRLSAAGAMLDFRYRVTDAGKAAALLDGRLQPYLLDTVHGARLGVPDTPVLGRIRQTARNNKIVTDRTYFIMFGNPGRALQSGDKVTLLLGQARVTELTVQ